MFCITSSTASDSVSRLRTTVRSQLSWVRKTTCGLGPVTIKIPAFGSEISATLLPYRVRTRTNSLDHGHFRAICIDSLEKYGLPEAFWIELIRHSPSKVYRIAAKSGGRNGDARNALKSVHNCDFCSLDIPVRDICQATGMNVHPTFDRFGIAART